MSYITRSTRMTGLWRAWPATGTVLNQELCALGSKLGFRASQIDQGTTDGGDTYFYCDLVSSAHLTPPLVYRESLLMQLLGECYRAEYDGWGTLVQKEPGAVEQ